ncbi:unnamed protein product [Linum trigynum]|uniref:Uncharacterized protein n=1 Tax=Linum trigynum TaxID=586398 RepID=A0AAV2FDB6_9ROSI
MMAAAASSNTTATGGFTSRTGSPITSVGSGGSSGRYPPLAAATTIGIIMISAIQGLGRTASSLTILVM